MTASRPAPAVHSEQKALVGVPSPSYHRRMDREHVELDAGLVNEVRDMVGVAQTTKLITRAIRHKLRLVIWPTPPRTGG